MKHLERAKRILKDLVELVEEGRADSARRNLDSCGVGDMHDIDFEDAEFLQELLREHINKWEGKT